MNQDELQVIGEKQAARLLSVAVQTLRNWRFLKKPPRYIKIGRSVRYQLSDLQEFMQKHKIEPEG